MDKWRITENPLKTAATLMIVHPSGAAYGALGFCTNIFSTDPKALTLPSGERPEDIKGVEVLDSWRAGGLARVTWADGRSREVIFGSRKPGTVGKLTGPRSFSRSRQRDGRRRG